MNRWLIARAQAFQARLRAERAQGGPLYGRALLDAIFDLEPALTCLEVAADDPFLGNPEAGFDQARYYVEHGLIVVRRNPIDPASVHFYIAHELGHHFIHTRPAGCGDDDLDPQGLILTLPYAEGRVATYHPRQIGENEATLFAAELLAPSERIAAWFDAGQGAGEIAERLQAPRPLVLAQLNGATLAAPVDFNAVLAQAELDPFHWQDLNASQKPACTVESGPALIQAGPGTGKTRTLTCRVEWLIAERNVAPETILALTFSNRAADELRTRLRTTVPQSAPHVTVATFHSFGLELLRRYADLAGVSPAASVLDPVEAEQLLEENLASLELEHYNDPARPERFLRDILGEIARAKEALLTASEYAARVEAQPVPAGDELAAIEQEQAREVARVYARYEQLLTENGLLDYGDLVIKPVRLLRRNQQVLEGLQSQIQHLLVDEYQDINPANGELVRLLGGEDGRGLWAVGDLRQSIYRFRGASPAYIRRFQEHYPGSKVYELQTNYRASERLVSFANLVAARMGLDLPAPVWQSGLGAGSESQIRVALADDRESELKGLADSIREYARQGYSFGDMAVLCRTNNQASEIAQALDEAGVPSLHLGKFFFRREIKEMLALLALLVDPAGMSWPRLASQLRTPLAQEQAYDLWRTAREHEALFPSAMAGIAGNPEISAQQMDDIRQLHRMLASYAAQDTPNPWLVLSDFLFEFGYPLRRLRVENSAKAAQATLAIGQLLNLARAFAARTPIGHEDNPTRAFIDHIRRLIDRDDSDVDLPLSDIELDAVKVLTIHKSKGLEFPIVFVPNLASGRFPSRGFTWRPVPSRVEDSIEDARDEDLLDEERCLFVALTRARQHLILSRAESYGRRKTGKAISRARSALWDLLDAPLAELGVQLPGERWVGGKPDQPTRESEAGGSAQTTVEEPKQLTLRAVRTYQRCPRQYYYRHVLELTPAVEQSPYLSFHEAVFQILAWLQEEEHAGRDQPWSAVEARLRVAFEALLAVDHPLFAWYLGQAKSRLRTLWHWQQDPESSGARRRTRVPAEVRLAGMALTFHIDQVVETQQGLIARRDKLGRVYKSHLDDPMLALYRLALAGGDDSLRVELRYPASGEIIEVGPQKDQRLLAQLEAALQGIQQAEFPPQPADSRFWRTCASCPYLWNCPIGERA